MNLTLSACLYSQCYKRHHISMQRKYSCCIPYYMWRLRKLHMSFYKTARLYSNDAHRSWVHNIAMTVSIILRHILVHLVGASKMHPVFANSPEFVVKHISPDICDMNLPEFAACQRIPHKKTVKSRRIPTNCTGNLKIRTLFGRFVRCASMWQPH